MNKKEPVNKKYGFTGKVCRREGHYLKQIYAVSSFGNVSKNQIGGWIQSPANLSEDGDCWVHPDGFVAQHAVISGDAQVYSGIVHDSALVDGKAIIGHHSLDRQFPRVFGNAHITNNAHIWGEASVSGFVRVQDSASVHDHATVRDHVVLRSNASVFHHAIVFGTARLQDGAFACCNSMVGGTTVLYDHCCVCGHTMLMGDEAYHHVDNKKYILDWSDNIEKDGHTLYRIIAQEDGPFYHNGQRGGYIESEKNLSQGGASWIQDGAYAYGDVAIRGDMVLRPSDCN